MTCGHDYPRCHHRLRRPFLYLYHQNSARRRPHQEGLRISRARSGVPNKTKVAKITKEQVQKIAEQKMPDLNAANIESAMSMIAGTARSMGIVGCGLTARWWEENSAIYHSLGRIISNETR